MPGPYTINDWLLIVLQQQSCTSSADLGMAVKSPTNDDPGRPVLVDHGQEYSRTTGLALEDHHLLISLNLCIQPSHTLLQYAVSLTDALLLVSTSVWVSLESAQPAGQYCHIDVQITLHHMHCSHMSSLHQQ